MGQQRAISLPLSILIWGIIIIVAGIILFAFSMNASSGANRKISETASATAEQKMACFESPIPSLQPKALAVCTKETAIRVKLEKGECVVCDVITAESKLKTVVLDEGIQCAIVYERDAVTEEELPKKVIVRYDASGSTSSCLEPLEFALDAPGATSVSALVEQQASSDEDRVVDCKWPETYDDKGICGVFLAEYDYIEGKIFSDDEFNSNTAPEISVAGIRSGYESRAKANFFVPYPDLSVDLSGTWDTANKQIILYATVSNGEEKVNLEYDAYSPENPGRLTLGADHIELLDNYFTADANFRNTGNGNYYAAISADPASTTQHTLQVKVKYGPSGNKQYVISAPCVLSHNKLSCNSRGTDAIWLTSPVVPNNPPVYAGVEDTYFICASSLKSQAADMDVVWGDGDMMWNIPISLSRDSNCISVPHTYACEDVVYPAAYEGFVSITTPKITSQLYFKADVDSKATINAYAEGVDRAHTIRLYFDVVPDCKNMERGTYNIDWGDGEADIPRELEWLASEGKFETEAIDYAYRSAGEYTVRIDIILADGKVIASKIMEVVVR